MGSLGNRSMSSALYRRYLSINGSRTSPDRYKVMHSFSFPIYADIKLVDLIFPSFFLAIFQMDAWQHVLRTGFRVTNNVRHLYLLRSFFLLKTTFALMYYIQFSSQTVMAIMVKNRAV